MLKANISKENKSQLIEVSGSIPEMANDVGVLLGGIYNQFKAVSPAAALLFRQAIQKLVADDNAFCWAGQGSQTGIALRLPGEEA